jgi:demethylmenaquinone methyltransferase / 2-methoxy-6-polyprenyl-1,4-benzoquinol methylase
MSYFMRNLKQEAIGQMFDRIASTYDLANRILSLRQDVRWRIKLSEQLPKEGPISILDIATGTSDLLISMCQKRPNIKKAIGIDISKNMLAIGQKKIVQLGFSDRIFLQEADASKLPFQNKNFDVVTIAFGIRNILAMDRALDEIFRVLKPHGRLFILEFSLPKNFLIRTLYLGYFRYILPIIGGFISKDPKAYYYLNSSVENFPSSLAFKKILLANGFSSVDIKSLSFGIANIYCARKL